MKISDKFKNLDWTNKEDGIVVPVILWWLGVPLTLVIILWLIF